MKYNVREEFLADNVILCASRQVCIYASEVKASTIELNWFGSVNSRR